MDSDSDASYAESLPPEVVDDSAADSAPSRPASRPSSRPSSRASSRARQKELEQRRFHDALSRRSRKAKYNDAYRVLFNEHVGHAAARFEVPGQMAFSKKQLGNSLWSSKEATTFFAALDRLGRHDIAGIASAIKSKTEPQVRQFLLLLHNAAKKQGYAKAKLGDIPAAVEIGESCNQVLELASDALALHQESLEAAEEYSQFGGYWLITPEIAQQLERELYALPNRESSEPHMQLYLHVRACNACSRRKIRCNRGTPCTYCHRRKIDCTYPDETLMPNPHLVVDSADQSQSASATPEADTDMDNPIQGDGIRVPREVPEAYLLKAETMLNLSKTIFMNRSPNIPSPWPHYSEYSSELAAEPSMYRTAFKDFHTLIVSITRRLVQTAIIQATSRLRSRPTTTRKTQEVKKRDVITAIDVLGLQRNAIDRWKGVARRCGLQVYVGAGSQKRHLTWSQVERRMNSLVSPYDEHNSDEDTTEPEDFRARATRSGTPLPMQDFGLSDSGDGSAFSHEQDGPDTDMDEQFGTINISGQLRSGYSSGAGDDMHLDHTQTLEEVDQEASRREECVLLDMLGYQPEAKDGPTENHEPTRDIDDHSSEKVITSTDDWRDTFAYRREWEEFSSPVPPGSFLSNQKPLPSMPAPSSRSQCTDGILNFRSDSSSSSEAGRRRTKTSVEVELQTHGTNAYAALQGQGLHFEGNKSDMDYSEAAEADIPTQSIEGDVDYDESGEEMDMT